MSIGYRGLPAFVIIGLPGVAAHAQPFVTVSLVPVNGVVVQGGSIVTIEAFVTVIGDSCPGPVTATNPNGVRFEGGQIDLPCILLGGTSGMIQIVDPRGHSGLTTDPDRDGLRGPSSSGIPYLFGPNGLGGGNGIDCFFAMAPGVGAPPASLEVGESRYLGTLSYAVSDCAVGDFNFYFEGTSDPPTGTNTTRFRDDCPAQTSQGPLLSINTTDTKLSAPSGRCCDGGVCLGELNEHCCLQIEGGTSWMEGVSCAEACHWAKLADCDDNNECTIDSCNDEGICVHEPVAAGTACGSNSSTECDNPDSCNGSGVCQDNHEPENTMCASDNIECTLDVCRSGMCAHPLAPPGTPCGNQGDSDCDRRDTCSASGTCQANLERPGTECETDGLFCNGGGRCQGGACIPGFVSPCDHCDSCDEAGDLCEGCPPLQLIQSNPTCNSTLWRYSHNVIRLRFNRPITLPNPEDIEIVSLLPNGEVGTNLFLERTFTMTLEESGTLLIIRVLGNVFQYRTWYAIRSSDAWKDVSPFKVDLLVQVGDATGDGRVLAADVSTINAAIPCAYCPDDRRDINGDNRILASDSSITLAHLPSRPVPKPSGHSCVP